MSKTYNNIKVELTQKTLNPLVIIKQACDITQKQVFNTNSIASKKLIKNLIDMNHTSLFEHIIYTFNIYGASRSFLAQITRHRISSFTSGSQHYQNYNNYGYCCDSSMSNELLYIKSIQASKKAYSDLIKKGYPKEEARQVLPNAMQNNLMWTINARSLINFLNLRLCYRNTNEIQIVSEKILILVQKHLPELFNNVGPDCFMTQCKQKKMSCNNKWIQEK